MLSEQVSLSQVLEWAEAEHRMKLSLPVNDFPRLESLERDLQESLQAEIDAGGSVPAAPDLMEPEGPNPKRITAQLEFRVAGQGRPELHGLVTAKVYLECQRCLQPVATSVAVDFRLLCFATESELDELSAVEQRFDALVMGSDGVDLHGVIEDEILSSLPLVPMHAEPGDCGIDPGMLAKQQDTKREMNRPFASLSDLLDINKRSDSSQD